MSDDEFRNLRSSSFTPIDIPPRQSRDRDSERPRQTRAASYVDPEAREAALRAELQGVEQINDIIENVLNSLDKAKDNMDTVTHTITSANALLSLYIRILSQTEHTTRLLLNENWQGLSNDIASIEADRIARREAEERRKAEERARQAERERQAAAALAKREAEERKAARGSRRTVGGRIGGSSLAERKGATTTRSASGIGRGTGTAKGGVGRTRGTGIGRGARS